MGEDADPLQGGRRLSDEVGAVHGLTRCPPFGERSDGQDDGLAGIPSAGEGGRICSGFAAVRGVAEGHGRDVLPRCTGQGSRRRRHRRGALEMPGRGHHTRRGQDAGEALARMGRCRGGRGGPAPTVGSAPLPPQGQAGPKLLGQGGQVGEVARGVAEDDRLSRLELEIRVESGVFRLHPIGQCVEGSHSRLAASHSQERPDGQVGGCGRFVVDLDGQHIVALHQPLPWIEGHVLRHAALVQLGLVEPPGPRVKGDRIVRIFNLVLHRSGAEHLMAVDERHAAVIVVEGQEAVHQARQIR